MKSRTRKILHAYEKHLHNERQKMNEFRRKKKEYLELYNNGMRETSSGYEYGDESYWDEHRKYKELEDKKKKYIQQMTRHYHRHAVDALPLPVTAKKDIAHTIRSFLAGKRTRKRRR